MNNRQRVFTALQQQNGSPLSPTELVQLIAAQSAPPGKPMRIAPLSLDAVTAALKWLTANGLAQKHRRRRDFGYTLTDNAKIPTDGRTREGRKRTWVMHGSQSVSLRAELEKLDKESEGNADD